MARESAGQAVKVKLNKSYVIAAVIGLCAAVSLLANAGPASQDEPTAASPLRQEYNTLLADIADDDAEAHYQLGMRMYLRYDGKGRNLEPLRLAVRQFRTAAGVFGVTLRDGRILLYNVEDDGETWGRIAQDYHTTLEDTYQLLHSKDADAGDREKSVEQFSESDRRDVLLRAAGNRRKAQTDAELARTIPVSLVYERASRLYKLTSDELKAAEAAMAPDFFAMAFSIIGGLGIFLIGMKNMSEGVQAVAGSRLRRMINAVTDNRIMAVGVGSAVTCLVQSSTITTVIVVGLVNSGLMALHQAIGVIMGANIGTTITGWILALKIGKFGLPILGVSVFFYLFARKDRVRYLAMTTLGLGMIFFGLEMMKDGFGPMKGVPAFEEAFRWFDASTYIGVLKCALVGCILTFLVQSSSATLGITIGLAATGAIPFETAGALVLGENIGTTITAWLASLGATTNAKRAAYAHVLFNVIGVFWITLIYSWVYVRLIGALVESTQGVNPVGLDYDEFPNKGRYALVVTVAIAATHTCFNVTNTLIFLPFVRIYARFLEWLMPQKPVKEAPRLTSLDMRMIESATLAIENSRGEIIKMADGCRKMLDWTKELINQPHPDEALQEKVFHQEKIMDDVQGEVIQFLTHLMTGEVPHAVTVEGRQQIRIADEFESVSDYISNVVKARRRLHERGLTLPPAEHESLLRLHGRVTQYLGLVIDGFRHGGPDILSQAQSAGKGVTKFAKELRNAHLHRLAQEKVDPVASMSYTTMVNAYRKVRDHALNIAEALAYQ